MANKIDFSQLKPVDKAFGETEKDTRLLREMADQAREYLLSFGWCKNIQKEWFGWGVGGIIAIFLIEIDPSTSDIDKLLWVIVGDLPPAYLVVDESPKPFDALRIYIDLMREWISAVREGKSTKECIPVDSNPTRKSADNLEVRLNFLEKEFLTN